MVTSSAATVIPAPLTLAFGNCNGVGFLSLGVSDPPAASEVQSIADKIDELINALRR